MKLAVRILVAGLVFICLATPALTAIAGCLTHTNNAAGVEICSQCGTGYAVSTDGRSCNTCPFGCKTCSGTVCSACNDGYYLNNGQCVTCPSGCIACDSQYCTGCLQTWFMTSTKLCAKCQSNCQTCSANNSCQVCNSGFNLKDGSCQAIQPESSSNSLLWVFLGIGLGCCPLILCCFCVAMSDTDTRQRNHQPYTQMTPTPGTNTYGNNAGYNPGYNAFANGGAGVQTPYGAPAANFNAGYVPPPAYNKTGGYY